MYSTFERIRLAALIAAFLAPAVLRADEGVLPNGLRIQGTLRTGPQGRLQFLTASRTFNLSNFASVRFTSPSRQSSMARAQHRITLIDGQHLTGELIELGPSSLRLQLAWTDKPLEIPRSSVREISHPPGEITLLDEDFEATLDKWRTAGEPELSERQQRSGRKSALLHAPGQKLEYIPSNPVKAGRLSLSYFVAVPKPAGARWLVEAVFAGDESPERVSVELAGRASTMVREAPGLESATTSSFVPTGWHQLCLEWRRDSLVVQVDDRVLHHAQQGLHGPLCKVRIRCVNGPAALVLGGEVWIDDLVLTRFVDELPHPPVDPEQDDVWLAEGDQLFGQVLHADRRTIRIQGRLGERVIPWSDVRAIHFRRANPPIRSSVGEHVRLSLGKGDRPDEIECVISSLDDRKLSFQHPLLGTQTIDRAWLRQIQGRFFGRRIELDGGIHHLGQQLLPDSPRPEGMALRRTFTVTGIPAEARLHVTVSHLSGPGDGPATARMLARGGLRTEVVLNGRVIDYLNRHAGRTSAEPRIITLALPASAIQPGDNVLELRQTVDQESGRSVDCVISGLVVEIPG